MWAAYIQKRGSLNTGYRVEVAVARLCTVWSNYNLRSKTSDPMYHIQDYAPHMDERVITIEELAAQMGAT